MNKIEELENEIEALKAENARLEKTIEELKAALNAKRAGAVRVAPEVYKTPTGTLFLRPGM